MRIKYLKAYNALYWGEKLPRKVKKHLLGKRMSGAKLRRLIKRVEVVKEAKTMFDEPLIKPHLFCPYCGHTEYMGSGNRTSYPEHWEYFHCQRCRKVVGFIDNSPFIHILEFHKNGKFPGFKEMVCF